MKELLNKFALWYPQNRGLFWGMLIGLIIAVLFLTLGFGATLLIIVCVGVGALLGSRPELRATIGAFFKNLFMRKR